MRLSARVTMKAPDVCESGGTGVYVILKLDSFIMCLLHILMPFENLNTNSRTPELMFSLFNIFHGHNICII